MTDNSQTLEEYLKARNEVYAEIITACNDKDNWENVKAKLGALANNYPEYVKVDRIYCWYSIISITQFFMPEMGTSRFERAEKEHRGLPAKCLRSEDEIEDSRYVDLYDGYKESYSKFKAGKDSYDTEVTVKESKKKKLVAIVIVGVLVAIIIAMGIFTAAYNPSLNDSDTNTVVEVNNKAFGWFGKFNTQVKVDELTQEDLDYAKVELALKSEANKFKPYNLEFTQSGKRFQPHGEFAVTMPIPENFATGRVAVYLINDDGTFTRLNVTVSKGNRNVKVMTKNAGILAIAEAPLIITYDSNGGSKVDSQKVLYGGTIASLPITERAGYTLVGWYCDGEEYDKDAVVTKDLTLTAKWQANKYTVGYYDNGQLIHTQEVTYDSPMELYEHEKPGYDLAWYNGNKEFVGGIWNTTNDMRLDAKWTAKNYTLTFFNYKAGRGATSIVEEFKHNVVYDNNFPTVEVPKRTGYVFDGYYLEQEGNRKEYYYDQDGNAKFSAFNLVANTTLTAGWTKDTQHYSGYEYIESIDDLSKVRTGSGKYLLVYDLDLGGEKRTPFPAFSGTFDGGSHCIYNFAINYGVAGGDKDTNGKFTRMRLGLFSYMTGTVKNLQVGKEGTTAVKISFSEKNYIQHVGMVVAALGNGGVIENCRAINCIIDSSTTVDDKVVDTWAWDSSVGGICGYAYSGSKIIGCYATNCNIKNQVVSKRDKIYPWALTGGICGFMTGANSSLEDCLINDVTVYSYASGGNSSKHGTPRADSGGIVGRAIDGTVLIRCVAILTGNTVTSSKSGSNGHAYYGSIVGDSANTNPSSLFRVSTTLQYSGSNSAYTGMQFSTNSYSDLITTDSTFNNGYWISENGKIALNFYK